MGTLTPCPRLPNAARVEVIQSTLRRVGPRVELCEVVSELVRAGDTSGLGKSTFGWHYRKVFGFNRSEWREGTAAARRTDPETTAAPVEGDGPMVPASVRSGPWDTAADTVVKAVPVEPPAPPDRLLELVTALRDLPPKVLAPSDADRLDDLVRLALAVEAVGGLERARALLELVARLNKL